MAEKYLGRLAHEKYFLKNLITDYRLPSANRTGGRILKKLCAEAFKALQNRQVCVTIFFSYLFYMYSDHVNLIHANI